jgi:hypothetical protein
MTEAINRINTVRAVGTLDRQRAGRGREETTLAPVWNAVRGLELSAVLQVRSPFGTPFQLPLRLDELVDGRELLACEPGHAAARGRHSGVAAARRPALRALTNRAGAAHR